jgi:UPF0716 family protein affecting phage T7 exclusion
MDAFGEGVIIGLLALSPMIGLYLWLIFVEPRRFVRRRMQEAMKKLGDGNTIKDGKEA